MARLDKARLYFFPIDSGYPVGIGFGYANPLSVWHSLTH